tara:strand:+ start:158 stop:994 length:837 start_codon:yes stop_codon:yes gene_type:complete
MSNGVLCFANNNGKVDYLKQAIFLAKRIKKHFDLPTSLVTSSKRDLDLVYEKQRDVFDKIIEVQDNNENQKRFYDGSLTYKRLYFKNNGRIDSYDLSPYENTMVMDTDFVICNDKLANAFDLTPDFQIYQRAVDLCSWRMFPEFNYINNTGIKFYWATCFFFRKTSETKLFFNLLKHLKENWLHYRKIYNLGSKNFRNDHIFSIAIHIMNGFIEQDWAKELPGTMYYTLDRDHVIGMSDTDIKFLVEKENHAGEYTLASTRQSNVHVMNKFSLERMIS